MRHSLREFWLQGYHRPAPGFILGLTRMVMGIFWLVQFWSVWNWWFALSLLYAWTGVSLVLGLLTKVGAACGVALTVVCAMTYAIPAGEPLWPYGVLILIHLVILATRCGQNLGIDQLLVEKLANWSGRPAWMPWAMALL